MSDFTKPSMTLLCKLGSLMVHVEEYLSPQGHEFDKTAIDQLLCDDEVVAWRKEMDAAAMLPKRR